MKNKKKTLSNGKKLLVALFFSVSVIFLGIFLGFFIKDFFLGIVSHDKNLLDESFIGLIFSFIIGLVFFITIMILLRDYDKNKKEKNAKWYVDKILFALIPVWMTVAMVLYSFYEEEDEAVYLLFSVILFLIIGIISTPNVVIYALKDMKNWKDIIYKNGNLGYCKNAKGFYRTNKRVPYERRLFFTVLRDQILNIFTIVLVILFFVIRYLFLKSYDTFEVKGNILYAIIHTKSIRSDGYMFFGAVFLAAFWIPIFAYYITNAIYKLRVVKRHEYIVFHAIVDEVNTFKLRIKNKYVNFKYDYCSCVGIKAKDINKTKSILIFVPDDLVLFPDNEKYKI